MNAQISQNDRVGKRLVAFIRQGIKDSESLMPAGESPSMLVCDFLSVKVNSRPACAYSLVLYFNTYGKQSPVMGHRVGICGKVKVKVTAEEIVKNLEETADRFRQEPGEAGKKYSP